MSKIRHDRITCAGMALLLLLAACAPQQAAVRPAEPELLEHGASALDRVVLPQVESHPGRSGFVLIDDGAAAYAVRAQSAALAGHSLDLQYYIWHDDLTGKLLAQALLAAADRGVRVRLLLDDVDARGKREAINALDAHPRIAVRLFNPLGSRGGKLRSAAEFGMRFGKLNHRMHNKAWIADGRIAIVGGRNIGDEYFSASEDVNFTDLDVALVGPAAAEFAKGFERYWSDEATFDLSNLDDAISPEDGAALLARLKAFGNEDEQSPFARTQAGQPALEQRLVDELLWSDDVRPLIDDPRKIREDEDADPGVLEGLRTAFDGAKSRLIVASPYFVPGDGGVAFLSGLRKRGIEVSVVTNSLAATDVAAVHAGYARTRPALIDAGVEVFEVRPTQATPAKMSLGGSSGASLHTKAAVVDDDLVFIGSFNLDPRSAWINCEQGVLVRSRELAAVMVQRFQRGTADGSQAWRVERDDSGKNLRWIGREDEPVIDSDPEATFGRRFTVWMARLLPIEKQL